MTIHQLCYIHTNIHTHDQKAQVQCPLQQSLEENALQSREEETDRKYFDNEIQLRELSSRPPGYFHRMHYILHTYMLTYRHTCIHEIK